MIVRYLDRPAIDAIAWDHCVTHSRQRLVYAFSWYLDALMPAWGGVVAEEEGQYLAVMPIPYYQKWRIRYVRQPDYCQQLGIFSRDDVAVDRIAPGMIGECLKRFKWVISYRFNELNETELTWPADFQLVKRGNQVLSLNKPYEIIRQGYATDRKINLNRAQNTGWIIKSSLDVRPLIQLHRTHNEHKATGGRKLDLTIYDRFARAVDQLMGHRMARVWLVQKNQQTEAGGLFVLDRGRIIYLFNGASASGRKKQARLWMIDHLIREFAGQSLLFDFESPVEGAESVKAYYQSFGAETRAYTEISYNRLPRIVRWGLAAKRLLRRGLSPLIS